MAVEVEFNRPLDELSQTNQVYSEACFQLVKWADRQGKLIDLVPMVATRAPGNPEFQYFLSQHWLVLLRAQLPQSTTMSENLLDSLIAHLQQIYDFNAVADCCRRTWLRLEVDRPRWLQALSNPELCPEAKWLIVLGLWLKVFPHQSDGTPSIISFVQRLIEVESIGDQRRQPLSHWLTQVEADLGIAATPVAPTLSAEQKERLQQIQAYCFIDINVLGTESIQPRCQLHIYIGAHNEFGENQELSIPNLPASDPLPPPEPLPAEAIHCCPEFLPIRQQIGPWLNQVEQRLSDKCRDLKQRYGLSARPRYDVIVEFCLPWQHLVEGVDAWQYWENRRGRQQGVKLGRRYKVIVRSRDRIQDLYGEINQLNTVWNSEASEAMRQGDASPADWANMTPILTDLESLTAADEDQLAAQFENYVGIGVSGPLCCGTQSEAREKLLNGVLEAGVPVVMWSRDPEIENLNGQLREDLLAVDCFRDFRVLIERIFEKRKSASSQRPMGFPAVWCDQPQRIEALNELFSRGRLG